MNEIKKKKRKKRRKKNRDENRRETNRREQGRKTKHRETFYTSRSFISFPPPLQCPIFTPRDTDSISDARPPFRLNERPARTFNYLFYVNRAAMHVRSNSSGSIQQLQESCNFPSILPAFHPPPSRRDPLFLTSILSHPLLRVNEKTFDRSDRMLPRHE